MAYKDCDCFCNGNWKCYGKNAENTCDTCRKCSANGEIYEAYDKFTLDNNCWQYTCFCLCNGTTWCPSAIVVNTCSQPEVCQQCEVEGRQIKGNTHFNYQMNGMEMHCRCNCDGGYVCIAEWLYVREDISISGQGIGSGGGSCFTCLIDGRLYNGDTRFAITRNGITMQCECYCNGGYYCLGKASFEYLGCRRCSIYGRRYNGDSSFPMIYGGMKLSCTCSCDGSYICYGSENQVVISCQGGGGGCLPSTCGQCIVDGTRFDGGDQFGTVYRNRNLRCDCGCDGSYYCEGEGGLIISCVNGKCRELGCSSCSVFGTLYSGDSAFDIIYRGMKLNCQCACGGSYQCFGSQGELIITCLSDGTGCLPNTCGACTVGNRQYAGLSEFRYVYEGIDMQCTCACDSSYYCRGVFEEVEIACVGGQCSRIGCTGCTVYGKTYPGESAFQLVYSGMLLQCTCSCDSGYRCVGSNEVIVVSCIGGRGSGCLTGTCLPCFVDNRQYAGLSEFRSRYKGMDIRCTCGCDGSSYCVGITTSIEVSCVNGVCERIGCKECRIFGKEYPGGAQFDMIYKGVKVTCECDCEGGYICKGSGGSVIVTCIAGIGSSCLTGSCGTCISRSGKQYRGGQTFREEYNGIAVDCTCSCDSSYFCVGVTELIELSCVGGTCTTSGCSTCTVFGKEYQGASKFTVVYAGMPLDCTCGCQGNYICYGESNTVIVQCRDGRGNCLRPPCRTCQLNGNQYAGLSEFQYVYEGINMNCRCGCDGSVFCLGISTDIRISCINGRCTPVGCTNCVVFGREYPALSTFDIVYSGYQLQCKCDCAGGYFCEGGTEFKCSQTTSGSCLPSTCDVCVFNGQVYQGRQNFKYEYNGIDMSCTCGCDGNVFCQGVTEIIEIRCLGSQCSPINCQSCTIFGQQYSAFEKRMIVFQGLQWECTCRCDSSYICVAEERRIECLAGSRCEIPDRCSQGCFVENQRYRVGEQFKYLYKGKIDMTCTCGCDGTSYCEGVEGFVISCIGDTCRPPSCTTCRIFGQEYSGDSSFNLIYKGVTMRCNCNCDGSYRCEGSSTPDVIDCNVGQRCVPDRCRKCRVNGRTFQGGKAFTFDYQGIEMSCTCGCDGSYSCTGVTIEIIIACQRRGGCRQIGGCRTCDIFGNSYPGGSVQRFVYRGYFMECTCRCDSSYRCIGTKDEVIVDCGSGRNCLEPCTTCNIDGKVYQGNSQFDIVYQGKDMSCTCGCDGSYYCECKTDDTELTCNRRNTCTWVGCNTCLSDGRQRAAFERFEKNYEGVRMNCECSCDGSYRCEGVEISVVIICTAESCRRQGCMPCVVGGQQYRDGETYETRSGRILSRCQCNCGNSECEDVSACVPCMVDGRRYSEDQEYERIRGRVRQRCRCECDGQSTCTNIQRPQCNTCVIDGERYAGHTRHRVYRDGQPFICDCYCNGEHKCSPERPSCNECVIGNRRYSGNTQFRAVLNGTQMDCTCRCDGTFICKSDIIQCTSESGCQPICERCVIDGQEFQANTNFEARVFGERMQCQCGCRGDYTCNSERRVCTHVSGCQSKCRTCQVSGKQYAGDSTFSEVLQGINMRCTCDCDGRYTCSGGNYVCTSEASCVKQCSSCTIAGRQYSGDTTFDTVIEGHSVRCTCDCSGRYTCTGTGVTCSTERPKCVLECRSCRIGGRSYSASSSFQAVVEGTMMRCSCDCQGNYECRGGNRLCNNRGCVSDCARCMIDGQTFSSIDTDFQADVFGYRMTCRCSCDGGYRCTSEERICTHTTGCVDLCVGCEIEGKTYQGGTRFEIYHNAYDVRMTCDCACGGSYTCRGTKTIPSCVGSSCPVGDQCNTCEIDGRTYDGNTRFETVIDGIRMNCTCSCSGSYRCEGRQSKCYGDGCTRDGTCHSCFIRGKRYQGNSQFEIEGDDGIRMKCTCDCTGRYSCRGERKETLCVGAGCDVNPHTCRQCYVDGRTIDGGTTFQRTSDDGILMDCSCSCNGVYRCEGRREICSGPNCGTTGCKRCFIDNRPYSGNTRFTFTKGSITYTCVCYCDGSYTCEGTGGIETSCLGEECAADTCRPCKLDNREYKLDAKFRLKKNDFIMNCVCECDGAYRCFSISGTCRGSECDDYGCSSCTIEGKSVSAGSVVELASGMICTCECSGHYECKSKSLSVHCVGADCGTSGCKRCNVDNDYYAGNTRFQFRKYGLLMSCACNCDSSYTCRGYQIISTGETTDLDGCVPCIVNGQYINGNTRFQTMIDGERKDCSCSCNGQHFCHDITECRDCVIGDETYPSNQAFTLSRNRRSITCRCDCNGNFICEGRRVVSGGHDGCSQCEIFDVTYKGDSRFTTDVGGVRMLCECKCTGEWICRGYRSITNILLQSEKQESCESCIVGGKEYAGNSRFPLQRGCFSIECICGCNGVFDCPTQVPRYTCGEGSFSSTGVHRRYSITGSHVYTSGTSTTQVQHSTMVLSGVDSTTGSCTSCFINNREYAGNSEFVLQDGCLRWTCQCDCNGLMNCTSVVGLDCDGPLDAFEQKQCVNCHGFGRQFPPNRQFTVTRDCNLYTCMCYCNGTFVCPAEKTVKTCDNTPKDSGRRVFSLSPSGFGTGTSYVESQVGSSSYMTSSYVANDDGSVEPIMEVPAESSSGM